jgi:undecaprenyl-diphosphatase
MGEWLQPIIAWVDANPHWAGAAVFLVSFTESMAIVGLLVPGVAMMFAAGALIAAGALDFGPVFAWAVAGAVAGDGLSYWLGRRFSDRMRRIWPFTRHPETLVQGEAFFSRYGGKSVALGRFFGPVRAVIPLVAGMMGMSPSRFLVANVLSAIAWAPAYLLPGIVLGASLQLASEVAGRLVLLIVVLVGLGWLTINATLWGVRRLQPHASAWVSRALAAGDRHRLLRETAHALSDPGHPDARALATFALTLLLATGAFALAVSLALEGGWLAGTDRLLHGALQSLRAPLGDRAMLWVLGLGDLRVLTPLAIGVGALLWAEGHHRSLRYLTAAVAFAWLAPVLLQAGLPIPRPPSAVLQPAVGSLPAEATLRATVVYGFLATVVARALPVGWRPLPWTVALSFAGAVAFAESYLGAHWPSDVAASLALGAVWLAALGLAYHRHARPEPHWLRVSAAALVCALMGLAWRGWLTDAVDPASYAMQPTTVSVPAAQWWAAGWRELPRARDDLRRRADHPLNVQYAGDLRPLVAALESHGWTAAPELGWAAWVKMLATDLPMEKLPVLPQVHAGRHESLALTKLAPDGNRWVLRLWPAWHRLEPAGTPLWIGTASLQERRAPARMLVFAATTDRFAEALAALSADLGDLEAKRPDPGRDLLLARAPDPPHSAP